MQHLRTLFLDSPSRVVWSVLSHGAYAVCPPSEIGGSGYCQDAYPREVAMGWVSARQFSRG